MKNSTQKFGNGDRTVTVKGENQKSNCNKMIILRKREKHFYLSIVLIKHKTAKMLKDNRKINGILRVFKSASLTLMIT